ncbi:MAG TPA: LysR family transcriptional regulator [Polyangiales bacterium]|nr:LysR family transcriptional regulator [Polyangiales bacterium]
MSLLASPLESFLAVASSSSISAAAKRVHVSQPAVTKQMRTLE